MKPNEQFVNLPKHFWAMVRLVGQQCGYTQRGKGTVLIPARALVVEKLAAIGIDPKCLDVPIVGKSSMWAELIDYLKCRGEMLFDQIEPNLMDAAAAKKEFTALKKKLKPTCPLPMNKQKGKKKAPAYLTGIVNMIVESEIKGLECDYDPRALATVTSNNSPVRTFSRRMDGAFPSVINPISVWEIKEYYYTTTFGSRVADGVYETLLDGMEIEELKVSENIDVLHYLILDAHYTWWACGKSYLCRIVDMLHMGYVDEVLVGREVTSRLPALVKSWIQKSA